MHLLVIFSSSRQAEGNLLTTGIIYSFVNKLSQYFLGEFRSKKCHYENNRERNWQLMDACVEYDKGGRLRSCDGCFNEKVDSK